MKGTAICTKLLHLSAQNQIDDLKQLVFSQTQEVKWKDVFFAKSGDTVVHVASRSGSLDVLKFFKENTNCNFEQANLEGKRPLHEAAQAGQIECVKYLISQNVHVDPLKRADWTPLMLACTKTNLPVIQALLAAGANPSLVNKDGWSSFHIACREGDTVIVKFLLTSNPDIWQTKSKNGRTPLHTAAFHGHSDIVQILLQASLSMLDITDKCGSTAFMDASRFNHIKTMELLHEVYNADLNVVDVLGQTSLHVAAQANAVKSIEYLFSKAGLSLNVKTTTGQTPLHLAAKEGNYDAIGLLIRLGAEIDSLDNNNRTARFITDASGFKACSELLEQNLNQ